MKRQLLRHSKNYELTRVHPSKFVKPRISSVTLSFIFQLKGESGVQAIKDAIDAGYRLFDTAFLYGNEEIVGQAIAAKIDEGAVTRDEISIVGKLWGIHHGQVERACRETCRRLGVDYVDLYLFHFPVSFEYHSDDEKWPQAGDSLDKDYLLVWAEMEKLVELGLTKAIGLSNFSAQQLQRVYDNSKIKPTCHEMEFHPAFCRQDLLKLCKDLEIAVLAYCPLGRHKAEKQEPKFLYDAKARKIAERHGKTTAQVALRFSIQSGAIPIPKSATKSRIVENFDVFDFNLDDSEMDYLRSFHSEQNQICLFHFAIGNKNYPF